DETVLDMNPLIDVCLVLLIFFILTTSYAALQKVLDMPAASAERVKDIPVVPRDKIEEFMIQVQARMEDGRPGIRVEKKEVDPRRLVAELQRWTQQSKKAQMLLDAAGVDWETVVRIQDAAKGADIQKVYVPVQTGDIPEPAKE